MLYITGFVTALHHHDGLFTALKAPYSTIGSSSHLPTPSSSEIYYVAMPLISVIVMGLPFILTFEIMFFAALAFLVLCPSSTTRGQACGYNLTTPRCTSTLCLPFSV